MGNNNCRRRHIYTCRIIGMKTELVEPVLSEIVRAVELCGGPARFARDLGVSTQTVCFWRDGKRRLRAEQGAAIEALTGGKVTRKDIWPATWSRTWPELASADAAEPTTEET